MVHSLKDEVYKLAYTILKNEHDSMDAYLQAGEKGLKNITNIKEAKYFKTWFLKIVTNKTKNIIAKNSKVIFFDEILGKLKMSINIPKEIQTSEYIEINKTIKDKDMTFNKEKLQASPTIMYLYTSGKV